MNSGFRSEAVPTYRLLTEEQIQEIHLASLELLETLGVRDRPCEEPISWGGRNRSSPRTRRWRSHRACSRPEQAQGTAPAIA